MKMKLFKFFCLVIGLLPVACSVGTDNPNRLYFNINPENRKIEIPIQLNDSLTANVIFDTGSDLGFFVLDSTFCANNTSVRFGNTPFSKFPGGSAWSNKSKQTSFYKDSLIVKIGESEQQYDNICINDRKGSMQSESDGLLSISKNDKEHIWELNFENNYLEIHNADNFKMPENCFVVPFVIDGNNFNSFNIILPLKVKCANGDTLSLTRKFNLDSGMPWDIMLNYNSEERKFFNKQENAVWLSYMRDYIRYHTTEAIVFDSYKIDSLRIYTNDFSNRVRSKYLIGLNFLKRFNVFFDMKNRMLGLQSINNFSRLVNPNYHRFYLSTDRSSQGKIIVREVGDYKANFYKTAGFRQGDEIVKVNGKYFKNVSKEQKKEFDKQDSLVYDIMRNGEPKQIVVFVDEIGQIGD